MFNLEMLCLSSIVLISLSGCLCSHVSPDVRVLSPSEFDIVLSPEENGTLISIRVSINKKIGFGMEAADYQKKNIADRVVHFSEKTLNLRKGDIIYYSMTFADGNEGFHGQDGNYIFNGVYKGLNRRRREVYEQNSEERNVNEDGVDSKRGRHLRHGPPRGHFSPHGPPHHHPGPHHFFPPPFGGPPFHGPGLWKGHGYDHKDRFGNNGPWDNHGDDDDCDSFGHRPKYPGGGQHPDNRKPWRGGNDDNPYSDNNNGNNGSNNPSDDKKPSKGSGTENGSSEGTDSGKNNSDGSNKGSENPNVEVFTTRKPSTTIRTTTVPNIDIRFRVPEDS